MGATCGKLVAGPSCCPLPGCARTTPRPLPRGFFRRRFPRLFVELAFRFYPIRMRIAWQSEGLALFCDEVSPQRHVILRIKRLKLWCADAFHSGLLRWSRDRSFRLGCDDLRSRHFGSSGFAWGRFESWSGWLFRRWSLCFRFFFGHDLQCVMEMCPGDRSVGERRGL